MMFKSMLLTSLLLSSLVSTTLHAQTLDVKNDPALRIVGVEVNEVEPVADLAAEPTGPLGPLQPSVELPTGGVTNPIDEVSMIIDGLLAIGKKIWPIIEAGRPVINNKLAPAVSVLPHLEGENGVLNLMENWSTPKVKSYRVSFKNGFNSEVVGFTYTVIYQYNGDLNGVGKYISGIKVQASEIYSAWGGFTFDASSELVSIANIGSQKAPVASAVISISYAVKGIFNESRSAQSFFIDGNGNFQVLNN